MTPFIIVYGAPRTGTSLLMDIVCKAGYNSGYCYEPPKHIRRGRKENEIFLKDLKDIDQEKAWKQIGKEKITCAKIIEDPSWIDFLAERFTVKIIAPYRNVVTREQSAADMPQNLVELQRQVLAHRDIYLLECWYIILDINFESLINRDPNMFEILQEFLEYNGSVKDLMSPVDIGRVKFNG